jgi:hypothetical protein
VVNKVANPEIVAGITAYLREHFPEVEFTTVVDGKTHSVIFRATCRPWYRLEVTTRFLEGAEGTATSLEWLRTWDLAGHLREARGLPVTLATTGLHIASRHPVGLSTRR